MALIRGHHSFDDHFTQIPNAWLRDDRISLAAIGLLAQLMSHKPGWEITQENLARANGIGRDAVRTLINQLLEAGYLVRSEKRNRNTSGQLGGYDYTTSEPTLGEPTLAQPTLAEPLHKKTIDKNTIIKKTIVKREHSIPETWKPKEELYSDEKYSVLDIDDEADSFKNWCLANGKKYKDWDAAFRNWLKKGIAFKKAREYKESDRDRQKRELDEWLASLPPEERNIGDE